MTAVDDVLVLNPSTVGIMAGINDLYVDGVTAQKAFERVRDLVQVLMDEGIEVRVYSVLYGTAGTRGDFTYLNPMVRELDHLLAEWCESNDVQFVDIRPNLCPDGVLLAEYSLDGLHPNRAGYETWAAAE